jgi:hypothetical protein
MSSLHKIKPYEGAVVHAQQTAIGAASRLQGPWTVGPGVQVLQNDLPEVEPGAKTIAVFFH